MGSSVRVQVSMQAAKQMMVVSLSKLLPSGGYQVINTVNMAYRAWFNPPVNFPWYETPSPAPLTHTCMHLLLPAAC